MPLWLVLLALLVLVSSASAPPAHAADEPDEFMAGKVTVIKPGKLAKFVAKPPTDTTFDLPDATNDPTTEGGQLAVFDTAPLGPAENTYALPAAGWTVLMRGKGYKYKGTGATEDPCKVVLVKGSVVKGACRGTGVTLTTPFTGEVGIVLTVGTDSKRYCASFGGSGVKNDDTGVKRKHAPPPSACPTSDMCTPGSPGCGWSPGDLNTRTQLGWDTSNDWFDAYDERYASTFGVIEVGIPGAAGFSMRFSGPTFVRDYLIAAGPVGPLNADLLDPTTTLAGTFGGEVLALQLNVELSLALGGTSGIPFGSLTLCNMDDPSLNDRTVSEYHGLVSTLLGGGSNGYSIATLSPLTARFNAAFSLNDVSDFAQQHLFTGTCP